MDGSLTEAAALEACLDFQRFIIERHQQGLSQSQIADLVGGSLALQVGEYLYVRECPSVSEVVATIEQPGVPERGP